MPEAAGDPPAVYGARLGAVREGWVAALGAPTPQQTGGELFLSGASGALVGWKIVRGRSRADIVGVKVQRPVPDAQMRRTVKPFHPGDAKPIRSYATPTARVEVYQSEALAVVFASATSSSGSGNFGSNPPGTFSAT